VKIIDIKRNNKASNKGERDNKILRELTLAKLLPAYKLSLN
jgi:hypothetical protein